MDVFFFIRTGSNETKSLCKQCEISFSVTADVRGLGLSVQGPQLYSNQVAACVNHFPDYHRIKKVVIVALKRNYIHNLCALASKLVFFFGRGELFQVLDTSLSYISFSPSSVPLLFFQLKAKNSLPVTRVADVTTWCSCLSLPRKVPEVRHHDHPGLCFPPTYTLPCWCVVSFSLAQ